MFIIFLKNFFYRQGIFAKMKILTNRIFIILFREEMRKKRIEKQKIKFTPERMGARSITIV